MLRPSVESYKPFQANEQGGLVSLWIAGVLLYDKSLFEDNGWKVPLVRPTVVFMLLMTVIWSFLVFDFIW